MKTIRRTSSYGRMVVSPNGRSWEVKRHAGTRRRLLISRFSSWLNAPSTDDGRESVAFIGGHQLAVWLAAVAITTVALLTVIPVVVIVVDILIAIFGRAVLVAACLLHLRSWRIQAVSGPKQAGLLWKVRGLRKSTKLVSVVANALESGTNVRAAVAQAHPAAVTLSSPLQEPHPD